MERPSVPSVRAIMTTSVVTLGPGMPAAEAAQILSTLR